MLYTFFPKKNLLISHDIQFVLSRSRVEDSCFGFAYFSSSRSVRKLEVRIFLGFIILETVSKIVLEF